jgi:hypothetical protein
MFRSEVDHLHILVPRLKISGDIPLFLLYAIMEWKQKNLVKLNSWKLKYCPH